MDIILAFHSIVKRTIGTNIMPLDVLDTILRGSIITLALKITK